MIVETVFYDSKLAVTKRYFAHEQWDSLTLKTATRRASKYDEYKTCILVTVSGDGMCYTLIPDNGGFSRGDGVVWMSMQYDVAAGIGYEDEVDDEIDIQAMSLKRLTAMNKYNVVVVGMEEATCRIAETKPARYISDMPLVEFAASIGEKMIVERGFFAICVISSEDDTLTFQKDNEGLVATMKGSGNE